MFSQIQQTNKEALPLSVRRSLIIVHIEACLSWGMITQIQTVRCVHICFIYKPVATICVSISEGNIHLTTPQEIHLKKGVYFILVLY